MKMRDLINLVEASVTLPINISGVDAPAHWTGTEAPEDANPDDVAYRANPFAPQGREPHAEIGMVGGRRAWIVSMEDGEEANLFYWTNGRCAAFAQAMNRIYGLPIWAYLEHNVSAEEEGEVDPHSLDSLIHAFVVAGDYAIDQKGAKRLSVYTARNGKPMRGDRFFDNDQCIHMTRPISVGELESFHENECHGSMAAVRHIRENKAFYNRVVAKALSSGRMRTTKTTTARIEIGEYGVQ